MDGPELLHWLEERLKEEREILERQHVLVLAQMQSMLPKRQGKNSAGAWMMSRGLY